MSFSIVIPARYASTRLPGKPLVDIAGQPMIQRVYQQARRSKAERIIIATDDQRIVDVATAFGAEVCMTSAAHESGTDRLQEVAASLALPDDHIVVNVQGDEPLMPAAVINQVAANLISRPEAGIATLVEPIDDVATVFDPNAVKVVMDDSGRALYFSRAPLPWSRDGFSAESKTLPADIRYFRHIGIYAYRVDFLNRFVEWPPSPLERAERLEQLRALEHGICIVADKACDAIPGGIDTPEDLQKVRALFE